MSKGTGGKQNPLRRFALILVGLYILGIVLGCVIIWAIPVFKAKEDLLTIAEDKGNQILSADLLDEVMTFGMDYSIYSDNGFVIYKENNFLYKEQWPYVDGFVDQVFAKGKIFVPTIFLMDNRGETPNWSFGVIIGVTVTSPTSGRQFASILLRDFNDLDTAMLIFFVLFTILYGVAIVFSAHTIRKERELNRMRRDLIANVSHELKTPITAIHAMAETLHDGLIKDELTRRDYAGKIIEESDHLEQLVLDILELSRLQSKRTEFHKETAYLDGIIPPIVDRHMMLCGDLGIHLDISGLKLEDAPAVNTDIEKIMTLMSTLLDNAVKFTGEGGTIWISNQIGAKHTTFCIRDNGPGIRGEDVQRIFDRFYKADIAHNSSGSGLGLAIADEIAKGLGEKLWVESKFGEGSAFYFTISY